MKDICPGNDFAQITNADVTIAVSPIAWAHRINSDAQKNIGPFGSKSRNPKAIEVIPAKNCPSENIFFAPKMCICKTSDRHRKNKMSNFTYRSMPSPIFGPPKFNEIIKKRSN
uniref:Uncharacterized protein n=1 Tax=Panagrolaimus davidi TaxID=227884 RepID=A0A914QSQ8_9BILA